MVVFKEFKDDKQLYLSVVKDEGTNARSGTPFLVRKSLLRPDNADIIVCKKNFPSVLHEEVQGCSSDDAKQYLLKSVMTTYTVNSFPLLGRRIISGSVRWALPSLKIYGEFSYTPGYWEWVEKVLARFGSDLRSCSFYPAIYASLYSYDRETPIVRAFLEGWCHSTNTLHTLAGELSISLWDLHKLGGLPIIGEIYDETIPSLRCLRQCDSQGRRILSRACEYLFIAYHHLSIDPNAKKGVTAKRWIDFWSGATITYDPPTKRRRYAGHIPKKTHNPSGKVNDPPTSWEDHEIFAFELLGIEGEDRRSITYLAAFLSCWLCVFVLPQSENRLIRPSTFEIAAQMAKGIEFNLTVPVLGSIYRGLNIISTSDKPAHTKCFFPAHFLYAWLAHYFSTHHEACNIPPGPPMVVYSGAHGAKYFTDKDARKLIHEGYKANVGCTISNKNRHEMLIDDGNLASSKLQYLISLRSGYLPLREGDSFHVEPYLPSRFSRQFGYCQDIGGVLPRSIKHRDASYLQALKYWQMFLFTGSRSRVFTPACSLRWGNLVTPKYQKWWLGVTVNDLRDKVCILQDSIDFPKPKIPTAGNDNPQPPQGKTNVIKFPCKRGLPNNEVDETTSDAESDVNFKHKGKKKHSLNADDFLDGVPSSDTAIDPQVGGDIGLELGENTFIGDNNDQLPPSPPLRKGKELRMSALLQNKGSQPTSSLHSVGSPFIPTAALAMSPVIGHVASAVTIQHGAHSGNIFNGVIKTMGDELLHLLHNAPFSDVAKVYREDAEPIFLGIERLKGDSSALRVRACDYVGAVKAFLALEKDAAESCHSEVMENEISFQREELKKHQATFADLDKECSLLTEQHEQAKREAAAAVQKAQSLADTLVAKTSSLSSLKGQIKANEQAIGELEAIPVVSAEKVEKLEELKLELLQLQSSLISFVWM